MFAFQSTVAFLEGRQAKRAVRLDEPMRFDRFAVWGCRAELDNASAGQRAIAEHDRAGDWVRRDGSFAAEQGKHKQGDHR